MLQPKPEVFKFRDCVVTRASAQPQPAPEADFGAPANCGGGLAGQPIIAAALIRSPDTQATILKDLAGVQVNGSRIELRARCAQIDNPALQGMRGDVLIIEIDTRNRQELDILANFVSERRTAPVVVTSPCLDVNSMCELMRMGVHLVVPQPIKQGELVSAVQRAVIQRRETDSETVEGLVVGCIGSCGGVGRTSIAVHAASALAQRRGARDVCLIDLDLQFGCAALLLDVEARSSILDLVQDVGRLDGALIRGAMVPARGVDLLAAPAGMFSTDDIEPNAISAVIGLARSEYALTILDLPLLWSYWTYAALKGSDAIFLIVQPTVSSLRQGRRQIEILRQENLDGIPLVIIVNRAEGGLLHAGSITIKDTATALGRKVDYVIPESLSIRVAAESGRPLSELHGGRSAEKAITIPFEAVLQAREQPNASTALRQAERTPFWRWIG